MTAIERLNAELNRLFDVFNEKYFNNELQKPIVTAQTNGKDKLTMGWCTTQKVWKDNKENTYLYEITICAEYLYRNVNEICATLIHEMVHLYHLQNDIKDTSRSNTYHNKKFKLTAEKCGLIIDYDKRIGWSITKLNEEARQFVEENADREAFVLTRAVHKRLYPEGMDEDRQIPIDNEGDNNEYNEDNQDNEDNEGNQDNESEQEKPKHSTRKYICPNCKTIIRATKEVNVVCGDCNTPFIKEEK